MDQSKSVPALLHRLLFFPILLEHLSLGQFFVLFRLGVDKT